MERLPEAQLGHLGTKAAKVNGLAQAAGIIPSAAPAGALQEIFMAGMPKRRAARALTEIAPHFPVAPKPEDWAVWPLAARLEHAFGCALDRAMDYLAWPPEQCDPHMLAAQKEAVVRMISIGAKFGIHAAREKERAALMTALAEKMMRKDN